MIKTGVIGLGKMGISHLSILGAHPDVQIDGVCDTSKVVLDVLGKYSSFPCFDDHKKMLERTKPDAVLVSVPTRFHYELVKELLQRSIHVFSEKPFCLNPDQSSELAQLAAQMQVVNQVGYHNKFVGTFQEVKNVVNGGFLGTIYHFSGEAYGPVVVRNKSGSWRSDPKEGGGCLMDYASHVIDLIIDVLGPIENSRGSILKSIFSENVDDAVYSLLTLSSNVTGILSVNWSDDTYRKMSTTLTVVGTNGKIISDANEMKVHFRSDNIPKGYSKGWNVKYVTDLTKNVDFYLRGEEYSAQLDYFIAACQGKHPNVINTFHSAWLTDKAISIIKNSAK